jgi:hypothetical protein
MAKIPAERPQRDPAYRITCPYCQRRFRTDEDLSLHVVTRHAAVEKQDSDVVQAASARR